MLLSLLTGTATLAQDVPVQPPPVASSAASPAAVLTACSPDGQFYALAVANGRIKYGRTQDGATLRTFYQCRPRALVFSADGRLLAVASASNGCPARLKVWRVADGAVLSKVETDAGSDPLMSSSSDGRLLASTGEGMRINVWQMPERTLKWSVTTSQPISLLALSGEGQAVVAVLADGGVRRFSVP